MFVIQPKILLIPSCGIQPVDFPSPQDTLIRLRQGLKLWRMAAYDTILVTGGIFHPHWIQTRPAAHIMRDWLINQGVPEDYILTEDKSVDTFENVNNSVGVLMEADAWPAEITVVTQWQHALRFATTFLYGHGVWIKTFGLHYPVSLTTSLNECLFIAYHLLDPTGKGRLAARNRESRRQDALTA
ncbi:MAG: YdcF family protein [Candidatus Omnitrophica bacterium]|nr:YdcF family protein [Candidatus Omnitrophota bacterium]